MNSNHSQTLLRALRRCVNWSHPTKQRLRTVLPASLLAWYAQHNVYLISYPKCGRTWLRLLLIRILRRQFSIQHAPETLELHELTESMSNLPRIVVTHGGSPHLASPDRIAVNAACYRCSRVVLLVRDPRDTIVSLYFHMRYRCGSDPGPLNAFIWREVGGIDSMIEFYNQWARECRLLESFQLVRYEQLQARPVTALRALFAFLGIGRIDQDVLRQSIEDCSFHNMREMERNGEIPSDKLQPGDVANVNSYKTRRGVVGGFRDYLSQAEIDALEDRINERLSDFYGDYKYCSRAA